jgi:ATP-dependent DNA helicase RecG
MISIEELNKFLLAPREGTNLEFKEAKTNYSYDKLLGYCVGIANEGGGHFILGVTDKLPRKIVGTQAFINYQDTQNQVLQKLGFRVDVEELITSEGRVLIFNIPGRPKGTAYNLDGAYLMRSTDELVPMSEDRLRAIFSEGKPDWLSLDAKNGLTEQEVIGLLDTQGFFDLLKTPYPTTQDAVIDKFEKEKLIVRVNQSWGISNLGAILFAKKLEDFDSVKRKAPRVIVYEDNNKLKTRLDRTGDKGYAVGFKGLVDFVSSQTPANEVIEKALRQEVKMFPEVAIRELVANALIHQDFNETGTSVMIEIYSDRIEISNPGKPFIQPERFIDEYQSRNENLANLMRRLGICEEKGSGVDRVVQSAEAFQLPPPDFRISDRRTTAVLFAHTDFSEMNGNDRVRACYQHCCLKWVMNETMTNQTLRTRFNLPESKMETASRIIRDTIEAGKIKAEGEIKAKKYARYIPFWA